MAAEHVPKFNCFAHANSKQAECITARMQKNIVHTEGVAYRDLKPRL
jgi:hypothetical protein